MTNTVKLAFATALLSTFATACGPESADTGVNQAPGIQGTPLDLQGFYQQGLSQQGLSQQGLSQQGLSQQGSPFKSFVFGSFANANGPISYATLNGTIFDGIDASETPISGTAFIGATLNAVRGDDTQAQFRIDDIVPSSDPDISLYQLAVFDGSAWVNPCGEDFGTPILALPLNGRWDYSSGNPSGGDFINDITAFTFSCTTGILAKCTRFGYKPWKTVEECNGTSCQDLSLQPFHQACTRMMRADYCGNGNGHTVDGTLINLYDHHGVEDDASATMPLEAEWTSEGAKCVQHLRWTTGGQQVIDAAQADIDENCSEIDDTAAQTICGTPFSTFTTGWGYSVPLHERSLLRSESEQGP